MGATAAGGKIGERKPFHRTLYVQVIAAILIGGTIGWLNPSLGVALQPLGDVPLGEHNVGAVMG